MELYALDSSFHSVAMVEKYNSIIWTERFNSPGDFKIQVPASTEQLAMYSHSEYLWNSESDYRGIIEQIQIDYDAYGESVFSISGHTLEYILDRRILWGQVSITGNLQDSIHTMLNDSVINPSVADRKIPNFIFDTSTDTAITSLEATAQFFGENLLTAIMSLCQSANIGFRVTMPVDGEFHFSLYAGTDRSYDQNSVPQVIFSNKFGNLLKTSYVTSKLTLRTTTLVGGEGEGADKKTVQVDSTDGAGSGLDRREIYTDASSVSSNVNGGTLPEGEYLDQLRHKGLEKMVASTVTNAIDGTSSPSIIKGYRNEFFIGDTVAIEADYGISGKARISEFIRSQGSSSVEAYPTFTDMEEES